MSGMSFSAVVCSLALIVIINVVDSGMIDGPGVPNETCECLTVTSNRYKPKSFKKFEILLPREYCLKTEILVTMMSGSVICLNPDAEWVKKLLTHLIKKNKADQKSKKAKLVVTPE